MSKQFTTEDFTRIINSVQEEFHTVRILPIRLKTMVEYTRENLVKEGFGYENFNEDVLENAITEALKSHPDIIFPNRRKMYRRAVKMLLIEGTDRSIKTQKVSRRLRLDMLNTEKQRGGDPSD